MAAKIITYSDPTTRIDDLCKNKSKAIKGKSYRLPKPYDKRDDTPESEILGECKDVLTIMKIWHRRIDVAGKIVHTSTGSTMVPTSMRGLPDIIGCLANGRMLCLELKRSGGQVSSEQIRVLSDLQALGALCAIVVSYDKLRGFLTSGEAVDELEGIPVV